MVKLFSTRVSKPLNGKKQPFQQMVMRKLDISMDKNKVGFLPYIIYKN